MKAASDSLLHAWFDEARKRPLSAVGLLCAALVIAVLWVATLIKGDINPNFQHALMAGTLSFTATAVGALGGIFLQGLSQRTEDVMLGFAAGMMLAASSFSLILPGIDAATTLLDHAALGSLVVALGICLGALLMLGLDRFTPHQHEYSGKQGVMSERLNGVWLFVMAITLHNFPEGMAVGVSFASGDTSNGIAVTTAISLQNIPEGLAVAMALRSAGMRAANAVILAALSGAMEPLGAVVGISISSGFALAYPLGMGLAAGAMIFVVSHEVIPETHRNGHQTAATFGLMGGFMLMMVMDTALG